MVRTVLALLMITLVVPTLVADPAAAPLDQTQSCRAAGLLNVPDCTVSHAGTATLVSCEGDACTVTLDITASAAGLPPGVQALEAGVIIGERTPLCSDTAANAGFGELGCAATVTLTIPIPSACRLILVQTTATADRVVSGTAYADIRVCKDGSVARP